MKYKVEYFYKIHVGYKCLTNYNLRDKLIIMAATCGVASANNMVNITILSYALLSNVALNNMQSKYKNN